jgi:hypothetical protein
MSTTAQTHVIIQAKGWEKAAIKKVVDGIPSYKIHNLYLLGFSILFFLQSNSVLAKTVSMTFDVSI